MGDLPLPVPSPFPSHSGAHASEAVRTCGGLLSGMHPLLSDALSSCSQEGSSCLKNCCFPQSCLTGLARDDPGLASSSPTPEQAARPSSLGVGLPLLWPLVTVHLGFLDLLIHWTSTSSFPGAQIFSTWCAVLCWSTPLFLACLSRYHLRASSCGDFGTCRHPRMSPRPTTNS